MDQNIVGVLPGKSACVSYLLVCLGTRSIPYLSGCGTFPLRLHLDLQSAENDGFKILYFQDTGHFVWFIYLW